MRTFCRTYFGILLVCLNVIPAVAFAQNALIVNLGYTPPSIAPGDLSVLTITIANNNGAAATALAIAATMPTGLEVIGYDSSASGSTPNCGGTQSGSGGGSGGAYGVTGGGVAAINNAQAGVCVVKFLVTSYIPAGQSYPTSLAGTQVTAQVGGTGVAGGNDATNGLTVLNMNPINGAKAFTPATVGTGGSTSLTINIANNNSFDMAGTGYTDNLPAGMTVLAAPAPTFSGCGPGSVTATAGSTSITLSGATLAPNGAVCSVTVEVQAPATTGVVTNTIPAGGVQSTVRGPGSATQGPISTTLSVQDQLQIGKAFATGGVNVGQSTLMTITINNPTQFPISNVSLSDIFPLSAASGTPPSIVVSDPDGTGPNPIVVSNTCSFTNTASLADGQASVSFSGGSLAAGASCVIQMYVRGNAASGTSELITNRIPIGNVTGQGGALGTTPVQSGNEGAAQLSVSNVGGGGFYTIPVVKYFAGASAVNVVRPPNYTTTPITTVQIYFNNSLPGNDLVGFRVQDSLSLPAFANAYGATLRVDMATLLANVTVGQSYGTPGGCTGFVPAFGPNASASYVDLDFGPTSRESAGGAGGVVQCVVSFPVFLDSSVSPESHTLGTYTNQIGDSFVTATVPNYTPGYTAPASSAASNVATLNVYGDLSWGKTFSPAIVGPSGISRLAITLYNYSTLPATGVTGVTFNDVLPAGLVLTAPGTATFSSDCQAGPGNFSSTTSGAVTTLHFTGLNIPAATGTTPDPGQCTLFLNVNPAVSEPVPASYTNTLTAGQITSDQGLTATYSTIATLSTTMLNIAANKSFAAQTVKAGQATRMTVRITNPNTATPLTNVSFSDTFPAGLVYAPNPNAGFVCSGGTAGTAVTQAGAPQLSITGMNLSPTGYCDVGVDVQLSQSGSVTNSIPTGAVTSNEGATNTTAASATIAAIPSSSVTKSIYPAFAAIGEPVTVTARVSNTTAGAIGPVSILDEINPSGGYPAGVVPAGYFVPPTAPWKIVAGSVALAATQPKPGCVMSAPTTVAGTSNDSTQLSGISVPAQAYCDITYQVVGSVAGQYRNAILASQVIGGPAVCFNSENPCFTSGDVTLVVPGSIAVTKQVTGGTPVAGSVWNFALAPTAASASAGCSTVGVTPNPLSIAAGATGTFLNVPPTQNDGVTACKYFITESGGDPNFVLSNPAALQNVSVTSGGTVSVTAINAIGTGTIHLDKVVNGAPAPYTGTFNFTIQCGTGGNFNESVTLNAGTSTPVTTAAIPAGSTCTITEDTTFPNAPAPASYSFSTNPSFTPAASFNVVTGITNVTATNTLTRQTGAVTVSKQVVGATAGYVAGSTFPITTNCVDPNGNSPVAGFPDTQNLVDGGAHPYTSVPVGSSCSVSEGATPATGGPQYQYGAAVIPAAVTVTNGGNATLVVQNPIVLLTAGLTVTKVVNGTSAGYVAGSTFAITVNCTIGGVSQSGFPDTQNLINGASQNYPTVPAGAMCSATEGTRPATADSSYVWGPPIISPPVVITNGVPASISVQNPLSQQTGSVTIGKQVTGVIAGYVAGSTFPLTLNCVSAPPGNNPVSGYPVTASLANGATQTYSAIPAGSTCTVSEGTLPSAKAGYSYGTPATPPAVVVGNGTAQTLTVQNVLTATTPVIPAKGIPTLNGYTLLLLTLFSLGLGANVLRRRIAQ